MAETERLETIATMRGAAAILEALNVIGNIDFEGRGDKVMAKIICDHESDIRELVGFAVKTVSESI